MIIVKGDIIKQAKAIPGFNLMGEEFEIIDVKDSCISFKSHLGNGVMGYDELNEYFEKVKKWTKWVAIRMDDKNYFYRHNYKTVQIVCELDEERIIYKASCHEDDEFDLQKGIEIAKCRCDVDRIEKHLHKITR